MAKVEKEDIAVKTEEISLNMPQVEIKAQPEANITLMIEGMMCMHCVRHVTNALKSVDGVENINVDLEGNKATVTADNDKIQPMIDAIVEAGYEVTEVINAQTVQQDINNEKEKTKMVLKIDGMMCMHCVKHVDKALNAVEGASNVVVNLEEKQASVDAAPELEAALVAAVTEAGYTVVEVVK